MSKSIIARVLSGLSDKGLRFEDVRRLLLRLEFSERIKGDHHIFSRQDIIEIINIQPLRDGKAKAYQVKQVRNLIVKYKLHKGAKDV